MAKGVNPIIAGVTGAALGAAAGIALSSKKTRNNLGKMISEGKEKGEATFHEIKKQGSKKELLKGKRKGQAK